MAVVFLEVGQDVHLTGGDLIQAVNEGGVERLYRGVSPLFGGGGPYPQRQYRRQHPAVIHTSIVPGEQVKITVAPKGFGSEKYVGGQDDDPGGDPRRHH